MITFKILKKVNIKFFLVITFLLLFINTTQVYNLYITRIYGDINFFDISGHIFMFINICISLFCSLFSWNLVKKLQTHQAIKLIITFLTALFIFLIATSIYYVFLRYFIYHLSTSLNMLVGNILFSTTTTHLYISGYTIAYMHFVYSRNLTFDVERLEKEKQILNAHLLKKNLEPHFLFNNLSILSGLVKTKSGDVDSFMDSFSDVYRYYLKHNDEEIVNLIQELEFIKSYQILLEKRFGKAYQIEIHTENTKGYLLPCSLQLCIENAMKHNKGSEKQPLKIEINQKNTKIYVKNELRPVDFTISSGLGNQYLQKRYELITGKKVEFIKTETHFIVEIPLIYS